MDIQTSQPTQSISDDQELAKALAGIAEEPEQDSPSPMQFEQTPAPVAAPAMPTPNPVQPVAAPAAIAPSGDLTSIKNQALVELRPLIDRVDLPADEKFDTYLLLLRSTDDSSLIGPAHAAAQNITDEKKKAEALLNIIKEIDYLSNKDAQPKV